MENIVLYIEKGLVSVIAVAVYVYLVSSVYPWLTMRLVWKPSRDGDRGLRRVVFPEGRGVVYEPAPRVRRYVSAYALFTRNGSKYIRCRVNPRIAYIRYDVVTLDRRGRLLDVVEVSERLTAEGSTRAVRLPTATAYACVVPRRVDGMYAERNSAIAYSAVGIGVFTGLTVLSTVAVAWLLHDGLTAVLATLLPSVTASNITLISVVAAVLGAVCAEWIVLLYYLHGSGVTER